MDPPLKQPRDRTWFWGTLWGLGFLVCLVTSLLYLGLPADGATGDLESFGPDGFRVQWLFEARPGGLRVGDVIVRADGYTVDQWVRGAPRSSRWTTGGTVLYEVVRDGKPLALSIRLVPIPLFAILRRWAAQLFVILALMVVGSYVFWKRPRDPAAHLLMAFCMSVAVHLWGDAYNFQFSAIPWQWAFWFQLHLEQLSFGLIYAPICYFALLFPSPHPWVKRHPLLVPWAILLAMPLTVAVATFVFTPPSRGLELGNRVALAIASLQALVVLAAFVRSVRVSREPVARAQVRWLLWSGGLVLGIGLPGYLVPLAVTGRPLIPHPAAMVLTLAIPVAWAIAVLRFRLFDVERVVNRTLVYVTLTLLLGAIYLVLVRLLTLLVEQVLRRRDDAVVVFVSALGIALAFIPLRQRVQAWIDRLFHRTRPDVQRLLPEMSAKLAASILPERLSGLLTGELPDRLQVAWAALSVLDMAGEHLVPLGGEGSVDLPVDHPLVDYLCKQKKPLVRLQPSSAAPTQVQEWLEQRGVELCIPLLVGSVVVGLYCLGPKLSGDAFSLGEVNLLSLLGQQAAVAVENSRLWQAERQQRRLAEALREAAAAVSGTLELDQVLDRLLDQVTAVVAGDAFNIMLVSGEAIRVVRWRGYDRLGVAESMSSLSPPMPAASTLAEMSRTGDPVVVSDVVTDPAWTHQPGWEWLRSYVGAPIRVAGRIVGFLNVDGTRVGQFGPDDARRLLMFADHAATAIKNAVLFEERSHLLEKTDAQARQVQQIIGTVPEGVLLIGADRRVLLANPTAREYLAVLSQTPEAEPLDRLGDRSLEEILVPPAEGLWHEVLSSAPTKRVFEVIAQPLRMRANEGWVLLVRDVTRERMIQEQVRLQERLAALGQLAGGIAHDFNNLLTVIMLGAENALWETGLPDAAASGLKAVLAHAQKASNLVRQILDFSRLSWIQTSPLSLATIVREAARILELTLPENIHVRIEVIPATYVVDVDPARIQQALFNLVFNARDAMPNGGELGIGLRAIHLGPGEEPPVTDMPPGHWACLEVSDTGTGIPAEVLSHLFEPFFTTKPIGRGTGLGLAQVYGIVRQHRGHVAVETQPGKGATFRIYLPILEEPGQVEEQGDADLSLPAGKGETVLLVEDDDGVRLYCQEVLQALGYHVLPAENGEKALEVYRSAQRVDLLLTDVVMPEVGGKELIARLREEDGHLRVLVMSGYGLGGLVGLLEEGSVHAVEKPIRSRTLAQAIRRILDWR